MKKLIIYIVLVSSILIFANVRFELAEVDIPFDIVFVSRQIPDDGSIYYAPAKAMPGVGNYSKHQLAAPGKLQILHTDGSISTLIDGSNPNAESLFLIDVNAPDVSYDGTKIIFAGLPDGTYNPGPAIGSFQELDAWRIYMINVDGTGLTQITGTSLDSAYNNLDYSQFDGLSRLEGYDDTDPVWLPDGRIVFSSTRYPGFGQYGAVRSSNLYVCDPDGANLHRISSEKNGADRPLIDPLTGKIVYSRWWRNIRFPYDPMGVATETVANEYEGYIYKDGLTSRRNNVSNGLGNNMNNNIFQIATINPDGTGLQLWSTFFRDLDNNTIYGGCFDNNGDLLANWMPIPHVTESSGFGGIRKHVRGANQRSERIIGLASYGYDLVAPGAFGIMLGEPYAAEPEVLPDGRVIFSKAEDFLQDYDLYIMDEDGTNVQAILINPGTTELRAKLIRPRSLPPIIPDYINDFPSLLPPVQDGPYDLDGTFVFDCLNIFFNADVDVPVSSAIPVGMGGTLRFFIDPQRHQLGSYGQLDWPILMNELPIDEWGRVRDPYAVANVPSFEQVRSPEALGYKVPTTGGGIPDALAHVTGFNYGKPLTVAKCVGCHAGHTMIEIPSTPEELYFTNLAPGAIVTTSSEHIWAGDKGYIVDRRVKLADNIERNWFSASGTTDDQWIKLEFLAPIWVKEIVLYNTKNGPGLSTKVHQATVKLFSDRAATKQVGDQTISEDLTEEGNPLVFPNTKIQSAIIELDNVSGMLYSSPVAAIGEIEIIAAPSDPTNLPDDVFLPKAEDDMVTLDENSILSLVPTKNDNYGGDGPGTSSITIVSGPLYGSAIKIDQGTTNPLDDAIEYTPNYNFNGIDQVNYQICDANGDCDEGTITFQVGNSSVEDPGKLAIKVFLQGALLSGYGTYFDLMRDDLRQKPDFPLEEPYTTIAVGDPTAIPPLQANPRFTHVGVGGGESTSAEVLSLNAGTPDAIVDWIFIELRDPEDPTIVRHTQSALLQRDGDVVDASDGTSPLSFDELDGQDFFVAVKHRNHLGCMTSMPVTLSNIGTSVDFTIALAGDLYNLPGMVLGESYNGMELLYRAEGNVLWGGDSNSDGKVKYQGRDNDITKVLTEVLFFDTNLNQLYSYDLATGYFFGDVNLNGQVKYQGAQGDLNHILINVIGFYGLNSTLSYQFDLFIEQIP